MVAAQKLGTWVWQQLLDSSLCLVSYPGLISKPGESLRKVSFRIGLEMKRAVSESLSINFKMRFFLLVLDLKKIAVI